MLSSDKFSLSLHKCVSIYLDVVSPVGVLAAVVVSAAVAEAVVEADVEVVLDILDIIDIIDFEIPRYVSTCQGRGCQPGKRCDGGPGRRGWWQRTPGVLLIIACYCAAEYDLLRVAEVLHCAVSDLGVCADAAPGARGHGGHQQQSHCDQYLHSAPS